MIKMKKYSQNGLAVLLLIVCFSSYSCSQQIKDSSSNTSRIISGAQLEKLFEKPSCLEGYSPNQTGPLYREGTDRNIPPDSTFTVQVIKIPSDNLLINGWLYLPLGESKCPLIVLTNGGGDDSRPIKSLSDFIAPVLAHCGIAAFVHDKRGTGESEGDFIKTTYDDYVKDAGNCAIYLSKHTRINPDMIGIMGGSEGGRIAVLAAIRFPVIKYVISYAGTVVSPQEDRLYATLGNLKSRGISDSVTNLITPVWKKSFSAWASNNPAEHEKVKEEILEMRKIFDMRILPFTKEEMDTIPAFSAVLPTWYSLPSDYMTELEHFNKKWFAIFGEVDQTVPTEASVKNILHYMEKSGNKDYSIAVIPKCGHAPVNVETQIMIRIDNMIINWINDNILKN